MKKQRFKVCAIYDTETTNIPKGKQAVAIPILYIINDIRECNLRAYSSNDDHFHFFRNSQKFINYINELIEWGACCNLVPIVCAYNLMFDLKSVIYDLRQLYDIQCIAQSSTHVYKLDLHDFETGQILLRFWDTFFLETSGLGVMGDVCGLEKAKGDWDYSLIRTPSTLLTAEELHYAKRDVQVIPAYLRWLLESNDFLTPDMLGVRVLTKTSVVRQFAKKRIGKLKIQTLNQAHFFSKLCEKENAQTFKQYAMRKACFRGGFTFTSATHAFNIVQNVASLDVCSMHHAFINGHAVPVGFIDDIEYVNKAVKKIFNTSIKKVLSNYYEPFGCAIHACIHFENLRLKEKSVFSENGIATLASAKFIKNVSAVYDNTTNPLNTKADDNIKEQNYKDIADAPCFAFSKLYRARSCDVWVSELELYIISLVYDFDAWSVVSGEVSTSFIHPPYYVTLQSMFFFNAKNEVKSLLKNYKEGEIYKNNVPACVPDTLAKQIKAGTLTHSFLNNYYIKTIKGNFNSIYGTQAQDVYKPDYMVTNEGELLVNEKTKINDSNFSDKEISSNVLYTYGMRIVGGSRLHLILAIIFLYEKFNKKIKITAGDTDSLKIACADDITDDALLECLEPLHKAVTNAIKKGSESVKNNFSEWHSNLEGVGLFEIEDCSGGTRYTRHVDYWNKARVSIDVNNKAHVTFAGLSRPSAFFNIENFIENLAQKNNINDVLRCVLGFNVIVSRELSFSLETHTPHTTDIFAGCVNDYLGNCEHVECHECNALYAVPRFIGTLENLGNFQTLEYLEKQNKHIEKRLRFLSIKNDVPCILDDKGQVIMRGVHI